MLDAPRRMWFHPGVELHLIRLTVTVACWFCLAANIALAGEPPVFPGITLPEGEVVADLQWAGSEGLILLVQKADGYALRGVELSSGDVYVIPVPRDFGNIRHDGGPESETIIVLSPGAEAIAVLERTANPLYGNELSVYRISIGGLESIATHRIPDGFNPNELSWCADSTDLYLAARPYVNPEQPYSAGRFNLASGRFEGTVLKANLDLIDSLCCIPGQNRQALVCRSYRGEFPREPLLAVVGVGTEKVIHSEAEGFELVALADGRLLFGAYAGGVTGGSAAWILPAGVDTARQVELYDGLNASYQTSADGRWTGLLLDYDASAPRGEGFELILQNVVAETTLETAEPCSAFAFSPDGSSVCAVNGEGRVLFFYDLTR